MQEGWTGVFGKLAPPKGSTPSLENEACLFRVVSLLCFLMVAFPSLWWHLHWFYMWTILCTAILIQVCLNFGQVSPKGHTWKNMELGWDSKSPPLAFAPYPGPHNASLDDPGCLNLGERGAVATGHRISRKFMELGVALTQIQSYLSYLWLCTFGHFLNSSEPSYHP